MESHEIMGPPSRSSLMKNLSFPHFHENPILYASAYSFGSLNHLFKYPYKSVHERKFSKGSIRKIPPASLGTSWLLSLVMVEPCQFSPVEPVDSYGLRPRRGTACRAVTSRPQDDRPVAPLSGLMNQPPTLLLLSGMPARGRRYGRFQRLIA